MMKAKDVVVWVNNRTHEIMLGERGPRPRTGEGYWCDPIGAAYSQWRDMNNDQRVRLMTETAIDLTMQGFDLAYVLRMFSQVAEFRALGGKSYPMCRALTSAITGKCLEPNTMSFEELLTHYTPRETHQ